MKSKELNSLSLVELEDKLLELKKELMKQNTQRATGTQLKNPIMISNLRKDIARILYLLSIKKKLVVKKHE